MSPPSNFQDGRWEGGHALYLSLREKWICVININPMPNHEHSKSEGRATRAPTKHKEAMAPWPKSVIATGPLAFKQRHP